VIASGRPPDTAERRATDLVRPTRGTPRVLASLTNRFFFTSAALVLAAIAVTMSFVVGAVTEQAETQLRTSLAEAASLVDEYGRAKFEDFLRVARIVADLPKLKAAVAEDDPPTVLPIANDYQDKVQADLFAVTGKTGRVLANLGAAPISAEALDQLLRSHPVDRETTWVSSDLGSESDVLRIAALPLLLEPAPGLVERLGTLIIGFRLKPAVARIRTLTDSDIAVATGGRIVSSTLDPARTRDLAAILGTSGVFERRLGGEDYIGRVQPLGVTGASGDEVIAIVLRSRTAQQQFLRQLYRRIAMTGLVAVLSATLLGYAIARTVTRPLRALTATMRDMAATGDLARTMPAVRAWDDEDARLLATTFRQLTTSLDRFRRESAQRERLTALGRLSTVIAHEVRNPLMIIKGALRRLRRQESPEVAEVAASIDEEVTRLNQVVRGVLDFARPISFQLTQTDLGQICRDAAQAAHGAERVPVVVEAPDGPAPVLTDAERLRAVLVNLLTNAQQAVRDRGPDPAAGPGPPIILRALPQPGDKRWRIEVIDRGTGIQPEDVPRLFEPFFTTRRTGSGLGLALARNTIEGLGGAIAVETQLGVGTTVRIDV